MVSGAGRIKLLFGLEKIFFGFGLNNVEEVFILLDDLARLFRGDVDFVCFLELVKLMLVIWRNVIVGGNGCTDCVFQLMKPDEKAQVDDLSGFFSIFYVCKFYDKMINT